MTSRATEPHPGHRTLTGGLARVAVFGVSDGLVSNVSLILGFAGSGATSMVVRLAGVAGAVAGAFSMAAGEWVSITSQNDLIRRELEIERRELEFNTEHETQELAGIYEGHGMSARSAATAADEVMSKPESALVVHAREELGVHPDVLPSPVRAAGMSLVCFLFGAILPVVPWFVGSGSNAAIASLLIGVGVAAVVGWLVGRFAEMRLTYAIARQVAIVLVACGITYLIGELIDINLAV